MYKLSFKLLAIFIAVILVSGFSSSDSEKDDITSNPLNADLTTLFSGSGNCITCHWSTETANTSETLGTVSPVDLWQASMMANSARDPLWQAKVSTETTVFPGKKNEIEDTCAKCHAPMGRTQHVYDNPGSTYSLETIQNTGLALDGVSCTACHQIQDVNLGNGLSYTGNYTITDERVIFGPYIPEYQHVMQVFVDYTPQFSKHVSNSEMCATCHTLITEAHDDEGNVVGEFFEQVNYIEWKNSIYEDEKVECQDCHLPALAEPIAITTSPPFASKRDTVHLHYLVGGNSFMINLMKDNVDKLEVTFTNEAADSSIVRTLDMLKNQTVDLSVETEVENDSLIVKVELQNKAGHKFPTGYPSRRVWIKLSVSNFDNVIFESGSYDGEGRIINEDIGFEPHYDIITNDDQIQIYEQVMSDYTGKVTYVLLKAFDQIKDNRLVPIGFTKSDATYDTVKIAGNAVDDPNFNYRNGVEGSGSDVVIYKIPVGDVGGEISVDVKVLFQTLNPNFIDHLFTFETDEVNKFKPMYERADKSPVVIAQQGKTINVTSINEDATLPNEFVLYQNYPNPFNPTTTITYIIPNVGASRDLSLHVTLIVYDALGNEIATLVNETKAPGTYTTDFNGNELASGIYYYTLTVNGKSETKKMLLIK